MKSEAKEWGFSMDLWLENNELHVANDGYITDNPIKTGKHVGVCNGFYYKFNRAGNKNSLINVIMTISEISQEVTA